MSAYDLLREAQGGRAISNIATQFGLTEAQADAAAQTLLPPLVQQIERKTVTRDGLADFLGLVGSGQHERMVSDPADPAAQAESAAIVNSLFGSTKASDAVIQRAAMGTGISGAILSRLLPYLASLLLGALFKGGGGGLGDILNRLPQAGGGGGRASMPGWPGGGSMGGNMGGAPAPQSGDNPFKEMGDLLRGGKGAPASQGPMGMPNQMPPRNSPQDSPQYSPMSPFPMPMPAPQAAPPPRPGIGTTGAIRDVLGSVLGFRGKGLLGWLVSWLLWRMGGRILRGLLGGIFRR